MPQRKLRMAGYIRESDINLADSTTIESQAKAVRLYGQKAGYSYDLDVHEYREAISAYTVPYLQRPRLVELLAAAKRGEFDVVVVTEIRAIGRRQVEVFIIYDQLQRYGVRLETISEKFEDSAIGRYILATRAMIAEVERENLYARLSRGRMDRIAIGHAVPNGQRCYGYILVDTERETHARYEYNLTVVYEEQSGKKWTEYDVVNYIFSLLRQGWSLRAIAIRLNDIGIPPPKKPTKHEPHWNAKCINRFVHNPIYTGQAWVNRYKRENNRTVERPREEWILLPDPAPVYIAAETIEDIKRQLRANKEDSLRNNKNYEEMGLGLLRGGYIFCGICGRRMHVYYPTNTNESHHNSPSYRCEFVSSKDHATQHRTQIHVKYIDELAKDKIVEVLNNPNEVREKIEAWKKSFEEEIDVISIQTTIADIQRKIQNLYTFAENAPDDEELARISERMKDLGKQKREAEALLFAFEEVDDKQKEIEHEIERFEAWVDKVKPSLGSKEVINQTIYAELRLAVRIMGIRATIYPTKGEWPYRHQVIATVPEVMRKVQTVWQSRT